MGTRSIRYSAGSSLFRDHGNGGHRQSDTRHTFYESDKSRGHGFALDDFGSGLSSFGYLKHLPVDFLKIDGTFIKGMQLNPVDRALVSAVNDIAHTMGLKTVAEYVENKKLLELVRKLGIDYAQGFAIDRPMPFVECMALAEAKA